MLIAVWQFPVLPKSVIANLKGRVNIKCDILYKIPVIMSDREKLITDGDDDDYNDDGITIPIWVYKLEIKSLRNLIKAHFCYVE